MTELFITEIYINKVRHLKNLTIKLSDTERKHLILTGINGSGKTSLLERIYLDFTEEYLYLINNPEANYSISTSYLNNLSKQESSEMSDFVSFDLNNEDLPHLEDYLFYAVGAKRASKRYDEVEGVKKIDNYGFASFLQHIVNMKVGQAFDQLDGNKANISIIDEWFKSFENLLKSLFADNEIELVFDKKNYDFFLKRSNNISTKLDALPDGYASCLAIVNGILMQTENITSKPSPNDLRGIVLIDEIEAHLHVELQKNILPILTSFFPKIQFIVSTHSPFVINSIPNAVVYDLENQTRVEDLTAYSWESLVESYFDTTHYSDYVVKQVERYDELTGKNGGLSPEEVIEFEKLERYFSKLPPFASKELQLKLKTIQLQNVSLDGLF